MNQAQISVPAQEPFSPYGPIHPLRIYPLRLTVPFTPQMTGISDIERGAGNTEIRLSDIRLTSELIGFESDISISGETNVTYIQYGRIHGITS